MNQCCSSRISDHRPSTGRHPIPEGIPKVSPPPQHTTEEGTSSHPAFIKEEEEEEEEEEKVVEEFDFEDEFDVFNKLLSPETFPSDLGSHSFPRTC